MKADYSKNMLSNSKIAGTPLPRVVPSSDFHEYVPGQTPLHVDNQYWNGLSLNVFHFPALNEGVEAPGIPGCGLAFFDQGEAKKAYYGYDGSSWTPHPIRSNTFQLVDSRCGPKWQWELDPDSGPLTAVNLILEPDLIHRTAYETLGVRGVDIRFDNLVGAEDGFIASLATVLKHEADNGTPLGRIYGETAAQLLAIHLLKNYSAIECKVPRCDRGLSHSRLVEVLEYLEANLNQDISLHSMARLCGLTPYHFSRLFKASTGMPPHQYLVHRRMEKAKQLLSCTQLPVLDIALKIGYQSQSHLSGLFKRCYGLTPRAFRQRQ